MEGDTLFQVIRRKRLFLVEENDEGREREEVESGVISNYGRVDAIRGADRSDRSHSKIKGKLRGMGGRVTRRIGHFNYTRVLCLQRRYAYNTVSYAKCRINWNDRAFEESCLLSRE